MLSVLESPRRVSVNRTRIDQEGSEGDFTICGANPLYCITYIAQHYGRY